MIIDEKDIEKKESKNIKYKIMELKAEVYELIKQQESLNYQIGILQERKLGKVREIQELEEEQKVKAGML